MRSTANMLSSYEPSVGSMSPDGTTSWITTNPTSDNTNVATTLPYPHKVALVSVAAVAGALIILLSMLLIRLIIGYRRNRLSVDLGKPLTNTPDDCWAQTSDSPTVTAPMLHSLPQNPGDSSDRGGNFSTTETKMATATAAWDPAMGQTAYDNAALERSSSLKASGRGSPGSQVHAVNINHVDQTVSVKCGKNETVSGWPGDQRFPHRVGDDVSNKSSYGSVLPSPQGSTSHRSPIQDRVTRELEARISRGSPFLQRREMNQPSSEIHPKLKSAPSFHSSQDYLASAGDGRMSEQMKSVQKSMTLGRCSSKSVSKHWSRDSPKVDQGPMSKMSTMDRPEVRQGGQQDGANGWTNQSEHGKIFDEFRPETFSRFPIPAGEDRRGGKKSGKRDRASKPIYATVSPASTRQRAVGGLEGLHDPDGRNRPRSAVISAEGSGLHSLNRGQHPAEFVNDGGLGLGSGLGSSRVYGLDSSSRHLASSREIIGKVPLTGGKFPLTPTVQQSYNRTLQPLQQQQSQQQQQQSQQQQMKQQQRPQQLPLEQAQQQQQLLDQQSTAQAEGRLFQEPDDSRSSKSSAKYYASINSARGGDVSNYSCESDVTGSSMTSRYARVDSPDDATDVSMTTRYADVETPSVKLLSGRDGSATAGVYSSIGGNSGDGMAEANSLSYASAYDQNWNPASDGNNSNPRLVKQPELQSPGRSERSRGQNERSSCLYDEINEKPTFSRSTSEVRGPDQGGVISPPPASLKSYEEVTINPKPNFPQLDSREQPDDDANLRKKKPAGPVSLPPVPPKTRPAVSLQRNVATSADPATSSLDRSKNVSIRDQSLVVSAEQNTAGSTKDPASSMVQSIVKVFQQGEQPAGGSNGKCHTLSGSDRRHNQQSIGRKKKKSIMDFFKRKSHSFDTTEYESAHAVDIMKLSQMKALQKSSDAIFSGEEPYEEAHKVKLDTLTMMTNTRHPSEESTVIYEDIKLDEEPIYEESIPVASDFREDDTRHYGNQEKGNDFSTILKELATANLKPTQNSFMDRPQPAKRSHSRNENGEVQTSSRIQTEWPSFNEIRSNFDFPVSGITSLDLHQQSSPPGGVREPESEIEFPLPDDDPIIIDNDCYGMLASEADESYFTSYMLP